MTSTPIARRLAACLALAGALPVAAFAADEVPPVHRVAPGDTLLGIAAQWLERPSDWSEIARLNRIVHPTRLPVGVSLRLPPDRLRGVERPAMVLFVRGAVTTGEPPKGVQVGDLLNERATLRVGSGAFASLRLADGSSIHVQADSAVTLARLREKAASGRRETVLHLDGGRVDATVRPQAKGSRFDVRTPLAVTGVRGTRFGVAVADGGRRSISDVVDGRVAVAAVGAASAREVAAGQGAVVRGRGAAPDVRPLLPPPRIAPLRIERFPFELPATPTAGAVAWRVQLAPLEDDAQVVFSADGAAPPVVRDLPDGAYRLSARARDPDGLLGAEAVTHVTVKTSPVPPLASRPAEGARLAPGPTTLGCTDVPGAVRYRLVMQAAGATVAPVERQVEAHCRFEVDLPRPGRYTWRVATVVLGADGRPDTGPFSDPAALDVVPRPPPPEPEVSGAEDGAVHWQGRPGDQYELQVARDLAFSDLVDSRTLDEPAARLALPPACVSYFLRLRTWGPDGIASPFSAPRRIGASGGACTGDGQPVRSDAGDRWGTTP